MDKYYANRLRSGAYTYWSGTRLEEDATAVISFVRFEKEEDEVGKG